MDVDTSSDQLSMLWQRELEQGSPPPPYSIRIIDVSEASKLEVVSEVMEINGSLSIPYQTLINQDDTVYFLDYRQIHIFSS